MKQVISVSCLLALGLSSRLNIGLRSRTLDTAQTAYDLNCEGASGNVKYYVDGIPAGVNFNGNTIAVSNSAALGNYTVRIKAVDEAQNTAERVITLTISQVRYGGQNSGNGANGLDGLNGLNGLNGANGGVAGNGGNGGNGSGNGPNGNGPNGNGPNGNGPNGGNGGSPSNPQNNARLNGILTSTVTTSEVTRPNYGPSGRFPDSGFPTGADPNIPNLTPGLIGTSQTQPTGANRKPVTADDVALRAASDRHQNASKGITNLLSIIDQARANRDKAQNDIQAYTQAYNDAVAGQRAAQNDIIAAETRVSQITAAINQLTSTVDDLRNKINQAVAQNDAWTRERTTISTNISGWQATKAGLLNDLSKLNQQTAQYVSDLSKKNAECSSLQDSIANKKNEITKAQSDLVNFNQNRDQLLIDIRNKAAIVDDLRNKLQQAQDALTNANIDLANLDARVKVLPGLINAAQKELADLQARARACADEVARIQALIDATKGDKYTGITRQVNDLDGQITISRTRVSEIDAAIAASQGPLADLRAKLAQANDDLTFIRSQKLESDTALRTAYQRGNDNNNRVAFARQNLDAVVKRFQDESKVVSDATQNLERARAEQALARQALDEFVSSYTNALPYAIVPNGNLNTNPGTPAGNNPSGSPLGPIRVNGNGAPGSFRVNNWTNYLSTAYGAGVNPSFPGSVTELFPFNFLSGVSGNMGQGTTVTNGYGDISGLTGARTGGCSAPSGARGNVVTSGVVVSVGENTFDVKGDDGKVFTVGVSPCSRLNANQANYKLSKGHHAVVRGWAVNGKVAADQATCLG